MLDSEFTVMHPRAAGIDAHKMQLTASVRIHQPDRDALLVTETLAAMPSCRAAERSPINVVVKVLLARFVSPSRKARQATPAIGRREVLHIEDDRTPREKTETPIHIFGCAWHSPRSDNALWTVPREISSLTEMRKSVDGV